MSTTEALRTQVDNLRLEIQQLQVENVKLKFQVAEALNEPSESASGGGGLAATAARGSGARSQYGTASSRSQGGAQGSKGDGG